MIQGVTGSAYAANTTTSNTKPAATTEVSKEEAAAIYEKSGEVSTSSTTVKATDKKDNSAIVAKLKADADARLSSLKGLVEKLFTKQSKTFAWANSTNTDLMNDSSFWNAIRTGDFTVDEATAAQAREDISENGYWGVAQTSDRLVDFAKALTGGDTSKVEQMRDAIKEGFEEAKKLWGGELPEISQRTYDATMEKLDKWAKESTDN